MSNHAKRKKLVYTFYETQNEGKWAESFNYLAPQFQSVWDSKGGVNGFVRGYKLVQDISDITVEDIRDMDSSSHFEVDYKVRETILSHPLTDAIKSSQMKDRKAFNDQSEKFMDFLVSIGGDKEEANKLQLRHFFSDNGVNAMIYLVGLDYTPEVLQHFNQNETIYKDKRFANVVDVDGKPAIANLKFNRHQLPS
ncbi:MAG TPA: hypothetical protein VGF14_05335 [Alphaproteobacteria bacterium]